MLHTVCPRTQRALAAIRGLRHRRSTFGSFRQRTIDRRYCGLLAVAFIAGPASIWFPQAVQAAGGCPSARCWQPFEAAPVAQPAIVCAACGQGRDLLNECGCSYVPVPASRYFHE